MPQARRSSQGGSARSAASSARSSTSGSRSTSSRSRSSSTRSRSTQTKGRTEAVEERLEVIAQRLRKLNERIIEAGKDAGETTLTNYEKALRAIAKVVERGPGSSEVEWVANLATAQAKFIRDVTHAWTSAARNLLK
jgi:hypothetical protein